MNSHETINLPPALVAIKERIKKKQLDAKIAEMKLEPWYQECAALIDLDTISDRVSDRVSDSNQKIDIPILEETLSDEVSDNVVVSNQKIDNPILEEPLLGSNPFGSTYTYVQNNSEIPAILAGLKDEKVLAIDTETTGLDPHTCKIRLVQIAAKNQPPVIIDGFKCDLKLLQPLFNNHGLKVFHNAKFDLQFLWANGLKINSALFDTMLAHELINLGKEAVKSSLKDIARIYLDLDLDKTNQKSDWGADNLSSEQLEYAVKDVQILLELREKLRVILIENELQSVAKLEFDCVYATAEMEFNGFLLDQSKLLENVRALELEKEEIEGNLKAILPSPKSRQIKLLNSEPELNLNSPSQLKRSLNAIGINCKSTGSEVLLRYEQTFPQIIPPLLRYRKISKLLGTYGKNLIAQINPLTNRLHTNFWQLKSTGRYSSSKPNIQNIPREKSYREAFIPAPGYKLVQCDYGQMELRIAAELYDEPTLIKAFKGGADIHKLTASAIYKKPLEEITKEERAIAKTANFGLLYGVGIEGFRAHALKGGIELTEAQAKKVVDGFFGLYKSFAKIKNLSRQATSSSQPLSLRTRAGRLMHLESKSSYVGNQYLNYPIQGLCADITKLALVRLREAIAPYADNAKIIAMVHDEILVEVREEIAEDVAKILAQSMKEAARTYLKVVPIETEARICSNWAEK